MDVGFNKIIMRDDNKIQKTPLTKALQTGQGKVAQKIINLMAGQMAEFTELELWQIKAFKNLAFKDENFLSLQPEMKALIYRTANNFNNIPFVSRLNSLGMTTPSRSIKAPGILSEFMDVASIHQTILKYLKQLRQEGKLLTRPEFEQQKSASWRKKSNFTRILGSNYLSQLIDKLGLKYIKVPEKKVVIESIDQELSFTVAPYQEDLMAIYSNGTSIYAQEIQSTERFLTREEINELFILIEASNYIDLWAHNFIVGTNEIYFIDTEFKSFSGEIIWSKMRRLERLISSENREWFVQMFNEKMDFQPNKEPDRNLSFSDANYIVKDLKPLVNKGNSNTETISSLASAKYVVKHCKLVGSNKEKGEGREFSFPMQQLLELNESKNKSQINFDKSWCTVL